MFFDLVILQKQHKGILSFAWVAATLGIKEVKKRDIIEIDIVKLCECISSYVCSESSSPRKRFSLRLSAILINGAVKLYRKKVLLFEEDLFKILTTISKPPTIESPILDVASSQLGPGFFETPPTPVIAVRLPKKRKHHETETPQSEMDRLLKAIRTKESVLQVPETAIQELAIENISRAEEITIREEQHLPKKGVTDEELGNFGTFQPPLGEQDFDLILQQLDSGVAPIPPALPPIPEAASIPVKEINLPEFHSEEPKKRPRRKQITSSSSESPQDIHKVGVHEVQVEVAPTEAQRVEPMEIEEIIQAGPQVRQEPPIIGMPRETLREIQLDEAEARALTDKKMRAKIAAKVIVDGKKNKIVRINRCEKNELELIDINPHHLPQFRLKSSANFTDLLNMYFITHTEEIPLAREPSSLSSIRPSISMRQSTRKATPDITVQLDENIEIPTPAAASTQLSLVEKKFLEVHKEPVVSLTPISSKRPLEATATALQATFEEVLAVAAQANGDVIDHTMRKIVRDEDVIERQEITESLLNIEHPRPEMTRSDVEPPSEIGLETISLRAQTEKERQQEIVNKVSQSVAPLTIEDLSKRPLTKFNIAVCFNDLLVLCKSGYVVLKVVGEGDSSLKSIEKGPKLLR